MLRNISYIAALAVVTIMLLGASTTAQKLPGLNNIAGMETKTTDILEQVSNMSVVIGPMPDFVMKLISDIPIPDISIPGIKSIPEPIIEPIITPAPTTTQTSDGQVCAQVVTQAENPTTGERKYFPTPCDVPEGWVIINP